MPSPARAALLEVFRVGSEVIAYTRALLFGCRHFRRLRLDLGPSSVEGDNAVTNYERLAASKEKATSSRQAEIDDLFDQKPITLETEKIRTILANRTVMVTGAGGNVGSELCRQIAAFQPQILLLVELNETHLFEIEQELIDDGFGGRIVAVIADVLDMPRMHDLFERYQPQVVFHAAAHKHVPLMEQHPGEAIKNNTLGTVCVATLAMEFLADRFVLVSTDKANHPANVLGATMRLAEMFLRSLSVGTTNRTKFMTVRFGNVLGSSGSVVPRFRKQIAAGGPVTVGHPEISRCFVNIADAAGLVLQCGAQGGGGELFGLDLGKPAKIVDLARHLIELSGLKPGKDIEIRYVGLRPGEKLHEASGCQGQTVLITRHPKIMRFLSRKLPPKQIQRSIQELFGRLQEAEADDLKFMLGQLVPDYCPALGPWGSMDSVRLSQETRAVPADDSHRSRNTRKG